MFTHPDGDPRTKFHMLAHVLTEERFERWELKGECLCGCEEKTRALHGRQDGKINYFVRGHYPRFYKQAGLKRPNAADKRVKNPAWRASVRKENLDRLVTTQGVQYVLEEYLTERKATVRSVARAGGFEDSWLSGVRTGRLKRIKKTSAIRLLTFLGEKPHPALFERHDGSPRRV